MIHQVHAPEADSEKLLQIVKLQLCLLESAANVSAVASPFDGLRQSLSKIYPDPSQVEKVLKWVTRKPNLVNALDKFSNHDEADKKSFVAQVKEDIQLLEAPVASRFQVVFDAESPDWKKEAGAFLEYFYDQFGKDNGFDTCLFPTGMVTDVYHRWHFIDGFTKANPNLHLCAVCDSTLYRTSTTELPYTSLEHYFPKSRYPHLAVHPRNLIPICPFCNSLKNDADPFGDDNLGLLGIILPYQTQHALGRQTYVVVKPCSDRKKHPLRLEILPNKDFPDADTFIKNFERIYGVGKRWNNDLDWIDQHVFRRVTQFFLADVQNGYSLEDRNTLVDRLKILMALVSTSDMMRDPFGFATVWLLRHHIQSIEEAADNTRVAIHEALIGWAVEQQKHLSALKTHSEELFNRVPS